MQTTVPVPRRPCGISETRTPRSAESSQPPRVDPRRVEQKRLLELSYAVRVKAVEEVDPRSDPSGRWLLAPGGATLGFCPDASAGIKGSAVGTCQTRRTPPTTPLWTPPTPPRERPRCCVTRAAFSATSTSSPPGHGTRLSSRPAHPSSEARDAVARVITELVHEEHCSASRDPASALLASLVQVPATRLKGCSKSIAQAPRRTSSHANMAPTAAAGHAHSLPSQRAAGTERRCRERATLRSEPKTGVRPDAMIFAIFNVIRMVLGLVLARRSATPRSHRDRALPGCSSHADR